jgi:hypothetical protein
MATTKITDLTAYTDPVNTDVLPIVDVTSDVTKKVSIANVMKNASLGSNTAPGIAFDGDPNTGIYSPGADQVAVTTGGTARLTASTTALTSTLAVDVPLGAQGTPSLTFTGDLNTGIYSPGADQVAISTNGTGRLFVNASGNVGVGTTSPSFLLTCATSADGVDGVSVESPSLNGVIRLRADGTNGNAIRVGGVGAQGNTLRFLVGSDVERMRIDSSGRLGLGTSSATARMTVGDGNIYLTNSSASASQVREVFNYINPSASVSSSNGINFGFRQSDTFPGRGASIRMFQNGTSDGGGDASTAIGFWTYNLGSDNGVERMRLTGTGLGIGTTSPSATLNVKLDTDGVSNILDLENGATSLTPEAVLRMGRPGTSGRRVAIRAIGGTNFTSPQLAFDLNESERMRIDASGRLLIGTSTARANFQNTSGTAALQVEGTSQATSALSVTRNSATLGPIIRLARSAGTTIGSNTILTSADPEIGVINFEGSDGSEFVIGAQISAAVDGTPGADDMPGRLVFATTADGASSPTEHVRIASNGITYIGDTTITTSSQQTTAPHAIIYSNGSTNLLAAGGLECNTTSTSARHHISFTNPNGVVGSISTSASATAYNTSSDYRLKENVVPLTGAIDRLQQIPVHRFNFIADSGRTVDGFIAHEAQAVVPECVTGTKDEVDNDGNPVYQGIDQSKLVPLLTAALQEAIGEIKSLKARVAALEGA